MGFARLRSIVEDTDSEKRRGGNKPFAEFRGMQGDMRYPWEPTRRRKSISIHRIGDETNDSSAVDAVVFLNNRLKAWPCGSCLAMHFYGNHEDNLFSNVTIR